MFSTKKIILKALFFPQDGQLVGAKKSQVDQKHIRSDKIMWIDGKEEGLSNIKFLMNQVRKSFNK
jgi:hypothetical protein